MWFCRLLTLLLAAQVDARSRLSAERKQELLPEVFFRRFSPAEFPKLTFAEKSCTSSKGRQGLCVGYPECDGENSIREGSCSDGFGTCCVSLLEATDSWQSKTTSTVSDMGSFFSNPDYPMPTIQAKSLIRLKIPSDVCQLRLDFDSLELPEKSVFQIKLNGNTVEPILAGNNTGQHLVLNVDDLTLGPPRIELWVSGPTAAKKWNIQIRNVYCFSSALAPSGCTQYFIHPVGRIRSLSVSSDGLTPYAVCLRPPRLTANVLSLKTLGSTSDCRSFMQVPTGMPLDGTSVPSKVCPKDKLRLTYKVFGPLVLYMITKSGQQGIDVYYALQTTKHT